MLFTLQLEQSHERTSNSYQIKKFKSKNNYNNNQLKQVVFIKSPSDSVIMPKEIYQIGVPIAKVDNKSRRDEP